MDAAGWYGKLPTLGDFAQRRLDPAFVTVWDDWLQRCVLASQQTLGNAWLEAYLTAHVWRFLLLPGVIDGQCWAGLMMPSVDRVGRYFPFSACLPLGNSVTGNLDALDRWLDGLESVARGALDPALSVDEFDNRLAALGGPLVPTTAWVAAEETALALSTAAPSFSLQLGNRGLDPGMQALARALLFRNLSGYSLWWCRDTTGESGGLAHRGLPEPHLFSTMLGYSPAPASPTS